MSPTDSELVVASLTRVRALLDAAERVCADSIELREVLRRARNELQSATGALRPVCPGLHEPSK